jgi:hypothetical protein
MAAGPSDEYARFVGGLVSLDEAQGSDSGPGFDGLMDRLTSVGGRAPAPLSAMLGGALLLLASGLAAVLPHPATIRASHFWRVASDLGADVVGAGHGAVLPMLIAAGLFLAGGFALGSMTDSDSGLAAGLSLIGGLAIGFVGLLWIFFIALLALNLVVLALIIFAYVVGMIVVVGIFFGLLAGLAS